MAGATGVCDPVEPAIEGGDVEDVEGWAAEGAVGRTARGERVFFQECAVRGEDGDAGARAA